MPKATLVLLDAVNCKFVGLDPITRKKFNEALKFMVPYARHTPQFKLKRWDGKISFAGLGGTTFINLLDIALPLIMDAGYEIEIDDQRPEYDFDFPTIDDDFLADRVWPPHHEMAGQPIMLRDYQTEAVNTFLRNCSAVQEISTGAGKCVDYETLIEVEIDETTEFGRFLLNTVGYYESSTGAGNNQPSKDNTQT